MSRKCVALNNSPIILIYKKQKCKIQNLLNLVLEFCVLLFYRSVFLIFYLGANIKIISLVFFGGRRASEFRVVYACVFYPSIH